MHSYGTQNAAGHGDRRRVTVVKGLDQNHFFTGLDQTQHDGRNGFRGATGDGDFCFWIHFNARIFLKTSGNGAVQFRQSKGARVLTKSCVNGGFTSGFHKVGAIKIGKTLPQIHGLVLRRKTTDTCEHAFAKVRQPTRGG